MISVQAWERLAIAVQSAANGIAEKTVSSIALFSMEECIKSGRVSETIMMIGELENQLRVLKRRLISSLPEE